ncbi:MAG: dTDP-4-amino-4,6-dideoxygalactose transaminase [Eubacteriales bacterium]
MNIPFNKIHLTGNELDYITQALKLGSISGEGQFSDKVSCLLEDKLDSSKIIMTTSGTHALEMAMMLLNIKRGDEVIMPSYTFPSTANAVLLRGGKPVFVDIQESTLTMDLEQVERKITKYTKAIIPVHYGGVGCPMDQVMCLSEKYHLFVVEDAAQALGSTYKNKPLGTWGHIGCFSFHGTKNYVSGEGGALSINENDDALFERAEIIRQKGTNRHQFIRGDISKYTWVDIGSSYSPSDILMAMLYPQIEDMIGIMEKRRHLVEEYRYHLKKYLNMGIIRSMTDIPEHYTSNYHNFYILFRDEVMRNHVMEELSKYDISACIHFVPLHTSPKGLKLGYKQGDLPITERVSDTLLRLPLYTDMTGNELNYMKEKLSDILEDLV